MDGSTDRDPHKDRNSLTKAMHAYIKIEDLHAYK